MYKGFKRKGKDFNMENERKNKNKQLSSRNPKTFFIDIICLKKSRCLY